MSSHTTEGDLEYVRILEVDGRLFLLLTIDGQFYRARASSQHIALLTHQGMDALIKLGTLKGKA